MKIPLLGIPVDGVTRQQALERVAGFLKDSGQHVIVTPNPEICLHALSDPAYRLILERADLSVADGFGLLWWSRFCAGRFQLLRWLFILFTPFLTRWRSPLPERIAGVDLMKDICSRFWDRKVFLLGASETSNRLTREFLVRSFGTRIVGNYSGGPSEKLENILLRMINVSGAEILFVAFGAPAQEKWIYRNLEKMPGVRIAMGVGGAFDFLSGHVRRAPSWIRKIGFEWLYRLILEPRRWRRILNAVVVFPWRVLRNV